MMLEKIILILTFIIYVISKRKDLISFFKTVLDKIAQQPKNIKRYKNVTFGLGLSYLIFFSALSIPVSYISFKKGNSLIDSAMLCAFFILGGLYIFSLFYDEVKDVEERTQKQ